MIKKLFSWFKKRRIAEAILKEIEAPQSDVIIGLGLWLGEEGIDFFKNIYEIHGTLNAVLPGYPPHVVHFREGMQVRNKLRSLVPGRGDHWYDDNWQRLILKAVYPDGVPKV